MTVTATATADSTSAMVRLFAVPFRPSPVTLSAVTLGQAQRSKPAPEASGTQSATVVEPVPVVVLSQGQLQRARGDEREVRMTRR